MNLDELLDKEYLNKGACSKCYILKDGNVFKKFNNPLNISDINRFKYLLEYSNESFLFPFDFVYDNKKFYGYITKRALGKSLEEVFLNSNLEDLSRNSIKLQKNIEYISEGKIAMYDFHSNNIMYDGKILEVIDPDEYGINGIYNVEYVKRLNLGAYRTMICNLFIFNIPFNKNSKYIIDRINKYKYIDARTSEIIINIKEDIEKHYKEKISTLEEFNKLTRR